MDRDPRVDETDGVGSEEHGCPKEVDPGCSVKGT